MEQELKQSNHVQKALITPSYADAHHQKSNKEFVGPGAELLREAILKHITEETNLKFATSIAGKVMCNKNLFQIYKNLKKYYGFEIKDLPTKKQDAVAVRANVVKALAYSVYFNQKEVFHKIVEELKKTITVDGDSVYKMKIIIDETDGEVLDTYTTSGVEDGINGLFWVEINYKGKRFRGIATSKRKARERACQKWLESHSIPY